MAFPADALTVRVQIALGADLTADPSTWTWTDITSYVEMKPSGITITRGRQDRWTRAGASSATLTLNNADGRFARLNPFGAYYGQLARNTPLRIQVDPGTGYQTRFTGYVAKWPPSWSRVTTDHKVTVTAAGIMRRLGKSATLRSPLYRSISGVSAGDYTPHAYWPMEDGSAATQFASAIPGGSPMAVSGTVSFAADDSVPGSLPLPTFATASQFYAPIPGYADTGQWAMSFLLKFASVPASDTTLFEVRTTGTAVRWVVDLQPSAIFPPQTNFRARGYDGSGTLLVTDTIVYENDASFFDAYGNYAMMFFAVYDNGGGSCRVGLSVASPTRDAGGVEQSFTGSPGIPTSFGGTVASDADGVSFGHFALITDPSFAIDVNDIENMQAMAGWSSELATDRISRLCREEQVNVTVSGTSTATMGAQPVATLLDTLRQCEDVDLGLLHESTDGKLRYLCNSSRYDAAASLTLDYDAQEIHPPFAPEDDDSRLVNYVIASRPDGSSATSVDQDSIDAEGEYKLPHTANAETDGQLDNIADWLRNLGTVDEYRIPAVTIELHSNPSLVTSWLACDIGSEVLLDNLPSPLPDSSSQIIEGYTERLREKEWSATLSCSPASPYGVGVYGSDATVSRYDSASSELAAAATSSATSLVVSTGMVDGVHDPVLWVTGSSAPTFPLDVKISGLVYAVSAIASAVTDPFTRTESNGWGTEPVSGTAYTTSGGSASDYSVSGGTARQSAGSVAVFRESRLEISSSDQDVAVDVLVPLGSPTGNSAGHWVALRYTDGSNHYIARLTVTTGGLVQLGLLKRVTGTLSTVVASETVGTGHGATDWWRVRAQILGSTLRAKAWLRSSSEPSGWTQSATDTSLTSGTQIDLMSRLESGNTNALPVVFEWDNLELVNPQRFTVTRLATDKALSAGEPVHVHPQARYAL